MPCKKQKRKAEKAAKARKPEKQQKKPTTEGDAHPDSKSDLEVSSLVPDGEEYDSDASFF